MSKAIEKVGLPTVIVCAITPIAKVVNAPRIVRAVSIPHPLGDPELSSDAEFNLRNSLVLRSLKAIATPIEKQTCF